MPPAEGCRLVWGERRQQRVAREQVFDVSEQQLLVLLLVMQPQCHDRLDRLGYSCLHAAQHPRVDAFAVVEQLLHRRARQQAAARTGVHGADAVVVGVEEVAKVRVVKFVVLRSALQHELFEEPGGVRQVPFGRTRIRHGLHHIVLGGQGRAQLDRSVPHLSVLLGQGLR